MPSPLFAGMRCPTAADEVQLASLMYHAYLGTIDYEGEDEAAALEEVRRTFAGQYGSFLWSASRVMERDAALASAALLTRWEGKPFVAFSMTRPEFKRRGLARACLESAVNQLLLEGEQELWLAVTLANVAAMSLYRKLGFLDH
jgi:ribosomal protein S18 acetylase RimI-like enzyme